MKTMLKVFLIVVVLSVAVKLSPIIFLAVMAGLLAAAIFGALGLSLLAVFAGVMLTLVAVLSPLWIPVLAIVGLVSLFKKLHEKQQSPSVTAACARASRVIAA